MLHTPCNLFRSESMLGLHSTHLLLQSPFESLVQPAQRTPYGVVLGDPAFSLSVEQDGRVKHLELAQCIVKILESTEQQLQALLGFIPWLNRIDTDRSVANLIDAGDDMQL
jgi:hypothetical protein